MPYKRYKEKTNSFPQLFADKVLSCCPLCNTSQPLWALDQKIFFLKPARFFYQCDKCEGVVSFLASDVSGLGLTPFSVPGFMKLLKGRKNTSVQFRVEIINEVNVNKYHMNKEVDLPSL